jgi:uncharacterized glyoxalase superfamily protein PhnB
MRLIHYRPAAPLDTILEHRIPSCRRRRRQVKRLQDGPEISAENGQRIPETIGRSPGRHFHYGAAMIDVHEVYPYLRVHSTAEAIEFYRRAFGAMELFRLTEPNGRIGHAEIKIGPTTVMLSDEYPECGIRGPRSLGGTTFSMHLHVGDVDRAFEQAVSAGASVVRPLENHFYGERSATVRDPFGQEWLLGGHLETVTPEEMQRRYTALFKQ